MINNKFLYIIIILLFLSGCASVPLKSTQESQMAKNFNTPKDNSAGLYIYRNSWIGQTLKKDIFVDGECVGKSAPDVFFYKKVSGDDNHIISTESEFSPNNLDIYTKTGENYFIKQYIELGLFVGGAGLKLMDAKQGKKDILELKLAKNGNCSK